MKRLFAKLGTLFVVNVIVLAFLVLGFGREYLRNLEIERNIALLQQDNEKLDGEKLQSLSVIESLSSEYYLEQEGRLKHGLARPGEELVIVHNAQAAEASGSVADEEGAANPIRWYYYFFDHAMYEKLQQL